MATSNKSIKNKYIVPAVMIALIGGSPMSLTSVSANDRDLLGDNFNISIDGEVNFGGLIDREGEINSHFGGSFVSLSVEWRNKVRAVVTAKLDTLFAENDIEFNDNFSIGEFIKEAYIEIREVGGTPVAVVVGKQPIPFAQGVEAMPFYDNNPLQDLQEIKEVYGVTVNLTEGLFGLFDQAEVSAFETDGGDLSLGRIDGVSIRLSRLITENWLLTLSHASLGNEHLDTGHENRTSIGLIGQSSDGVLVGWVEGMYISNNPKYLESNYGITAGAMMRVHRSTDVIVEYSWIEKELQEIGLGVRTALTRNLSLGAEVRYQMNQSSRNDIITGIVLTYTFGNTPYSHNYDYLFGEQDDFSDFYN